MEFGWIKSLREVLHGIEWIKCFMVLHSLCQKFHLKYEVYISNTK